MKICRLSSEPVLGVKVWELDFGNLDDGMLLDINRLLGRSLQNVLGYYFLTSTIKEGKIVCYTHLLVSYKKMTGAVRESIEEIVPIMENEVQHCDSKDMTDLLWEYING